MSSVAVIAKDMYYTNGLKLYRVVHVFNDGTVSVEDCLSLKTKRVKNALIYEKWRTVNPSE